jgi:hypothetical protein
VTAPLEFGGMVVLLAGSISSFKYFGTAAFIVRVGVSDRV